jgi:hypothetical protein
MMNIKELLRQLGSYTGDALCNHGFHKLTVERWYVGDGFSLQPVITCARCGKRLEQQDMSPHTWTKLHRQY